MLSFVVVQNALPTIAMSTPYEILSYDKSLVDPMTEDSNKLVLDVPLGE